MSNVRFAVFPDSVRYHPTQEDDRATLCGISTKPSSKNHPRQYPPARLLHTRPVGYTLCPRCADAQRKANRKGE